MIKKGTTASPADWIGGGPLDNSPDHWSGLSNGCATFPQRPGRRKPVGSGGWDGVLAGGGGGLDGVGGVGGGGKSVDPPTDFQLATVFRYGKHETEKIGRGFKGPFLLLSTFGKRKSIVERMSGENCCFSSRQQLDCWNSAL